MHTLQEAIAAGEPLTPRGLSLGVRVLMGMDVLAENWRNDAVRAADPIAYSLSVENMLFHGSPIPPEEMGKALVPQPSEQMPVSFDYEEPYINQPVISSSSVPYFPIVRSLLHHAHPAFEGRIPTLTLRRSYTQGRSYLLTVKSTIDTLDSQDAHGYLYMNAGRTRSSIFHPRRDQGEHRHTYELSWRGVLQTQLADLCLTNLLVFDADGETIKNYIKTHAATQDPFAYSRSQGISLHTAKELLSKEIRP